MPCSSYFRTQRVCRISGDSSQCLKYVRQSHSYNSASITSSLSRNIAAQDKISQNIKDAELRLAKALARLARLRKQRQLLNTKSSELAARLNRELNKEDSIQSQEKAIVAEQSAIGEAQSLGAKLINWSALGIGDFFSGSSVAVGPSKTLGSPQNTASSF
ncbi:hypothetical protein LIA77_11976 [Sarocladium implicatum]|nr:hypothetical protein LIA77_11976 [Sarocladium implicatum]